MLNYICRQWHRIPLILLLLPILPVNLIPANHGDDRLAYTVFSHEGEKSLWLYDPDDDTSSPVLTNREFMQDAFTVGGFAFSVDGQVAYWTRQDGNTETYVIDAFASNASPINISQNPIAGDFPLEWSPDGRYLAFASAFADAKLIYVWDGETATNVTPNDLDNVVRSYDVAWSFDGQLAFTVWYDTMYPPEGDTSEIFLWDRNTTVNLSQNPTGEDRFPTWNADGRLAFLSIRKGNSDILIWDGVSTQNGIPDADTFTNLLPELTDWISEPTWTNEGHLAFSGVDPENGRAEIYLWDEETVTNISQNPGLHDGAPRWSDDGRWAFVTFFSSQQLLYVRDVDNRNLLTVDGQYTPAWSSNGYLVYCRWERSDWILSMWDGQDIIEIARGREVLAQWQSGSRVVCSSG